MIRFDCVGTAVRCSVRIEAAGQRDFHFELDTDSEWAAVLLRQRIMETLNEKLGEIRRENYERGWKDSAAKRKKCDWFSPWW